MKGEFQRYPGHPATTCLSPAMGWIWNLTASSTSASIWPDNKLYRDFKAAIYAMAPFTPTGNPTSQGASKNTQFWLDPDAPKLQYYDKKSGAVIQDVFTKHLYTSVDEMLFKSTRFNSTTGTKEPQFER